MFKYIIIKMIKTKNYSINDVFNGTRLGFEIDFYTNLSDNILCEIFSKLLLTDIQIHTTTQNINNYLYKEYTSEKSKYVLYTSTGDYFLKILQLKNIIEKLNEIAYVDNNSILKINLEFNHRLLNTPYEISHINIDEFLMYFDYSYFNDVYSTETNPNILSYNGLRKYTNITYTQLSKDIYDKRNINLYGIDFTNQKYNVLSFKFINGNNMLSYDESCKSIYKYIEETFNFINSNKPELNKSKVDKVINDNNTFKQCYNSVDEFVKQYNNIYLTVDLLNYREGIKTYWNIIKPELFNLVSSNKDYKGAFNYDTKTGRFQLKSGEITCGEFTSYDIVDCDINHAFFTDCVMVSNRIKDSLIHSSCLYASNNINNTNIFNSDITGTNTIKSSKIYSYDTNIIESNCEDSLIYNMMVSNNTHLVNCTVINNERITYATNNNENNFTERSYTWIKSFK